MFLVLDCAHWDLDPLDVDDAEAARLAMT